MRTAIKKAAVVSKKNRTDLGLSLANRKNWLGLTTAVNGSFALAHGSSRELGVEPTKYGRALLNCDVAVFDELRQGVKNIEFLADPTAGEVRIGSIPPLAASFVPTVVDRLSRRYPGIVFHLVSESTELLHRRLHEREVDILVTQRVGAFAAGRDVFS